MFNVPPLVKSNHVSVNSNLLGISALGFLIAIVYVSASAILKKRMNLSGVHLTILMVEAAIIAGLSAAYSHKALTFFGVM